MDVKRKSISPGLSLIGLLAIGHLPLGLPEWAFFILPMVIGGLIYTWSLKQPESLPSWFVFTLGLLADVLSSGPIGYWPLFYLACQAVAFWLANNPVAFGLFRSWGGFLMTASLTTLLSWSTATLYYLHSIDWQPMVIGAAIVCAVYPVIFWLSGSSQESSSSALVKNTVQEL